MIATSKFLMVWNLLQFLVIHNGWIIFFTWNYIKAPDETKAKLWLDTLQKNKELFIKSSQETRNPIIEKLPHEKFEAFYKIYAEIIDILPDLSQQPVDDKTEGFFAIKSALEILKYQFDHIKLPWGSFIDYLQWI